MVTHTLNFRVDYRDVIEKIKKLLWICFFSKRFGKKYRHVEVNIFLFKKQYLYSKKLILISLFSNKNTVKPAKNVFKISF